MSLNTSIMLVTNPLVTCSFSSEFLTNFSIYSMTEFILRGYNNFSAFFVSFLVVT